MTYSAPPNQETNPKNLHLRKMQYKDNNSGKQNQFNFKVFFVIVVVVFTFEVWKEASPAGPRGMNWKEESLRIKIQIMRVAVKNDKTGKM